MPTKSRETKGPIAEETPPQPEEPNLASILAIQVSMGNLLQQIGPNIVATAARAEDLEQRIQRAETALVALVEVVRQLHAGLNEMLVQRR